MFLFWRYLIWCLNLRVHAEEQQNQKVAISWVHIMCMSSFQNNSQSVIIFIVDWLAFDSLNFEIQAVVSWNQSFPITSIAQQLHKFTFLSNTRGCTGSVVRALAWRSKGRGFESCQEHKKKPLSFSESVRLCWLAVGVPNPRVYMHAYKRPCTHVKDLLVHVKSSVDYGNMKITSMLLYPRRWNVAAQVAEELITVTYATPPMEERRNKEEKKSNTTTRMTNMFPGPQAISEVGL